MWAAASCSSPASWSGRHRDRARGGHARRRDRRHCTLSGCIIGGGARIGDNTHITGLSVLGEGVTVGADNVLANGARLFPGVELPDGAIRF